MSFHLNRLIGTDLLLAGFESFLRYWFPTPKPRATRNHTTPLPGDPTGVPAYDELPEDVRHFYELDDELGFTPDYGPTLLLRAPVRSPEGSPHICILRDNLSSWIFSIAPDEEGTWRLYQGGGAHIADGWRPIEMEVTQMLVGYALYSICHTGTLSAWNVDFGSGFNREDFVSRTNSEAETRALNALQASSTAPTLLYNPRAAGSSASAKWDPDYRQSGDVWLHRESGLIWTWEGDIAEIGVRDQHGDWHESDLGDLIL